MSNHATQEVCALLGQPVAGNPTQFMIEKAFDRYGLDWRYLSFEVAPEGLADAIRGMRALGFRGGNITKPHKVAVIPCLDRLTPAAELIGAVNCLVRQDGQFVGENTDGKGFLESLRTVTDPAGKEVVMLGAGGAARAMAVELALAGARRIRIVNRSSERGTSLVELLRNKTAAAAEFVAWDGDFVIPVDAQIVVQATSLGMNEANVALPVDFSEMAAETVVADVIINPPDTLFLRQAKEHGAHTLDGLGMLVNQGAIGFRLWTGIDCDRALLRDAVEEYLSV